MENSFIRFYIGTHLTNLLDKQCKKFDVIVFDSFINNEHNSNICITSPLSERSDTQKNLDVVPFKTLFIELKHAKKLVEYLQSFINEAEHGK